MDVSFSELMEYYQRVVASFKPLYNEVLNLQKEFPHLLKLTMGMKHGTDHWCRVGTYSLAIAEALKMQGRVNTFFLKQDRALEDAVLYAAFFHDCARRTEGVESGHGRAGEEVWRRYSGMKSLSANLREAVSQALLFHVDHPAIDPSANEVTICLCNADRLDRIRLGEDIDPSRMYEDGIWLELAPHNRRLFQKIKIPKVKEDLGI